jgi:putative ABC transport system permease protein
VLRVALASVALAFKAILQWPMRAALTVFGILVGIAAVVITVALGEGAEVAVQQQLKNMGENAMSVGPEATRAAGSRRAAGTPRLTEDDAAAIVRDSENVTQIAPLLQANGDVAFGGFTMSADLVGTSRSFFEIRVWPLSKGSLWSEQAEATASRVCVIGANVALELFGESDPVGRVIRIERHTFLVTGVLAIRTHGATVGNEQDNVIKMPVSTMRSKLRPTEPGVVDRLIIKSKNEAVRSSARKDVTEILRQRHGLLDGMPDDFWIREDDSFRETQARIVGALSALLTSVAAISLLVGGIGIMNILLVSVTERTREIGLRMAIGATRGQILLQFLTESVVLSLIGGALGLGLSAVGTIGIGSALSIPMRPSPTAALVALGVSTTIGLVFGLIPSWRAASLDPIVALGRQ